VRSRLMHPLWRYHSKAPTYWLHISVTVLGVCVVVVAGKGG
jgi:hypothetical protein